MKLKFLLKESREKGIYLKQKKLRFMSIILIFLGSQTILSQENFVATGEEEEGNFGSITYSIGQIFFQETDNEKVKLNTGLQTPYYSYVFTEPLKIKLELSVYPNPTVSNVTLLIKDYKPQNLNYKLFSIEGKLIRSGIISQAITSIYMDNLPSSTYILYVVGWINQGSIKIIKQ